DAEVFKKIVDPRLLSARDLATACYGIDQVLVKFVSDQNPKNGAESGERRRIGRIAQCPPYKNVDGVAGSESLSEERARKHQQIYEEEQSKNERNGTALVRLDVRVEPVGSHFAPPSFRPRREHPGMTERQNLTCGACSSSLRCSTPTSKKSFWV